MPECRNYIFALSRGSRLDSDTHVFMYTVAWHGGGQYIDAPSNELEAQMLEIEQTMRRFVIQATPIQHSCL